MLTCFLTTERGIHRFLVRRDAWLEDAEGYYAIPGSKLAAVVGMLGAIQKANRQLETFHQEITAGSIDLTPPVVDDHNGRVYLDGGISYA